MANRVKNNIALMEICLCFCRWRRRDQNARDKNAPGITNNNNFWGVKRNARKLKGQTVGWGNLKFKPLAVARRCRFHTDLGFLNLMVDPWIPAWKNIHSSSLITPWLEITRKGKRSRGINRIQRWTPKMCRFKLEGQLRLQPRSIQIGWGFMIV